MRLVKDEIAVIKTDAPKAWADFSDFLEKHFGEFVKKHQLVFEDMPFEMQLGVYKMYFSENGVDFDTENLSLDELKQDLVVEFKNFENVVSHFS